MGDIIERNTEEEEAESLAAEKLTKAVLNSLLEDFLEPFNSAVKEIVKLKEGEDFYSAFEAVRRVADKLSGSKLTDFAAENDWLFNYDDRQKYLNGPSSKQSRDVKNKVIELYQMVKGSEQFRMDFYRFLSPNSMKLSTYIYGAIHYDEGVREMVTQEEMDVLPVAFAEYEALHSRFNTGKIYERVLETVYSYDYGDVLKAVQNCMIEDLEKTKSLKDFILRPGAINPEKFNDLGLIDRTSEEYHHIRGYLDVMKELRDEVKKLRDSVPSSGSKDLISYTETFKTFLDALLDALDKAIGIMEEYTKDSTAVPYCILTYHNKVRSVANSFNLADTGDPRSQGTRYQAMVRSMAFGLKSLSEAIAKSARSEF